MLNEMIRIFILTLFVVVFTSTNSLAVLLIFELGEEDVLMIDKQDIPGGTTRMLDLNPGIYQMRLLSYQNHPVVLKDDEQVYEPKSGKVLIKKALEVTMNMEGETINLTLKRDEEDVKRERILAEKKRAEELKFQKLKNNFVIPKTVNPCKDEKTTLTLNQESKQYFNIPCDSIDVSYNVVKTIPLIGQIKYIEYFFRCGDKVNGNGSRSIRLDDGEILLDIDKKEWTDFSDCAPREIKGSYKPY